MFRAEQQISNTCGMGKFGRPYNWFRQSTQYLEWKKNLHNYMTHSQRLNTMN